MIDSGAFTAWKNNKEIRVEAYCDFLHKYRESIECYFNLDVINPEDREDAAKRGHVNYTYMVKRGLKPIPVFHQGEDLKWFYRMLDEGADYIALATSSMKADPQGGPRAASEWYNLLWNDLVNKGGHPHVRVHALGDTRQWSLTTYPWYSTDSSAWAQTSGRGGTMHLVIAGRKVNIGIRHDGKSQSGRDIAEFEGLDRDVLKKVIEDLGIPFERLLERRTEDHVYRLQSGAYFFKHMLEFLNKNPPTFNPHAMTFFSSHESYQNQPAIPIAGCKIYLASWMSTHFNSVLETVQYPLVLLTYAYMGGFEDGKLEYGLKLMGVRS
jgi:hypothetical protein